MRGAGNVISYACDGFDALYEAGSARTRLIWIVAVLYVLLLSALFSLSRGEFVSATEELAFQRTADFQAPVLHSIQGTLETLPIYQIRMASVTGRVFPAVLLRAAAALGADFNIALGCIIVLLRALAVWAWMPWFSWLRLPRWFVFIFAPLLIFGNIFWGRIYGYIPGLTICGQITVALFLLASGLALLGRSRNAVVVWLLQGWTHPSTFASWSLLFLAIFLLADERRIAIVGKRISGWRPAKFQSGAIGAVAVLLALLPVLGAWAAGLAEHWGIVQLDAGRHYWDWIAVRSMHSFFGGMANKADYPAVYLLLIAGLFLLSMRIAPIPRRMHILNLFFACTGLAYYVIYISLTETRFSILSTMLLPLRFETLYIPLYLLNMLAIVFRRDENPAEGGRLVAWIEAATRILAALLAFVMLARGHNSSNSLYYFPLFVQLLACVRISLSSQQVSFEKRRSVILFILIVFMGFTAMTGMLYIQTATWPAFLESMRSVLTPSERFVRYSFMAAAGGALFAWERKLTKAVPQIGFMLAVMLMIVLLTGSAARRLSKVDMKNAWNEMTLIYSGVRARTISSPWNAFRKWHETHIGMQGKSINYPQLLLPLIGMSSTSVDGDNAAFTIYAPDIADALASDVQEIYGIDVREYAEQGRRFSDLEWNTVKDRYLHRHAENNGKYQWLIEPSALELREKDALHLAYENAVVRVYAIQELKAIRD